jgi:hypothetical protein
MSGETLLASTDLLLRGGVCALLLIAALLARDYSRVIGARLGALFALGTAAYAGAPRRVYTLSWGGGRLPFWRWRPATRYVLAFRSGAALRRFSLSVMALSALGKHCRDRAPLWVTPGPRTCRDISSGPQFAHLAGADFRRAGRRANPGVVTSRDSSRVEQWVSPP